VVSTPDVVEAYAAAARANTCAVHGPVPRDEAPRAVAGIVRDDATTGAIAVAAGDPALRGLPLTDALAGLGRELCSPDDDGWDECLRAASIGLTGARLAVAEQGMLALACGLHAPRATSLLPPTHVCVVFTDTILPTFAEAIERVAAAELPSALTWVGGPSRTGDLEMVTTLGVHGPKAVEVVLVDG
jgi:L-lactate dehydrogenase complex protein LldG